MLWWYDARGFDKARVCEQEGQGLFFVRHSPALCERWLPPSLALLVLVGLETGRVACEGWLSVTYESRRDSSMRQDRLSA